MKKYIIAALSVCFVFTSLYADTKRNTDNKKSVYEKQAVSIPMADQMAGKKGPQKVAITAPDKQLYGEWTILSVNKIDIDTDERAIATIHLISKMAIKCMVAMAVMPSTAALS